MNGVTPSRRPSHSTIESNLAIAAATPERRVAFAMADAADRFGNRARPARRRAVASSSRVVVRVFRLRATAFAKRSNRRIERPSRGRRSLFLRVSPVQTCDLANEQSQRPAIDYDVVHRRQREMFFIAESQQNCAQQWAFAEVERSSSFDRDKSLRFSLLFARVQVSQIDNWYCDLRWRRIDDLHCLTINFKRGAKHFVTTDNLSQSRLEGSKIQWTSYPRPSARCKPRRRVVVDVRTTDAVARMKGN